MSVQAVEVPTVPTRRRTATTPAAVRDAAARRAETLSAGKVKRRWTPLDGISRVFPGWTVLRAFDDGPDTHLLLHQNGWWIATSITQAAFGSVFADQHAAWESGSGVDRRRMLCDAVRRSVINRRGAAGLIGHLTADSGISRRWDYLGLLLALDPARITAEVSAEVGEDLTRAQFLLALGGFGEAMEQVREHQRRRVHQAVQDLCHEAVVAATTAARRNGQVRDYREIGGVAALAARALIQSGEATALTAALVARTAASGEGKPTASEVEEIMQAGVRAVADGFVQIGI